MNHGLTTNEHDNDELMLSFGLPACISLGDGYVVLDKPGAVDCFNFYLKDHLGNVPQAGADLQSVPTKK
jgi:hypothetical protein